MFLIILKASSGLFMAAFKDLECPRVVAVVVTVE